MQWVITLFVAIFLGLTVVFWKTNLWQNDRLEKYVSFLGAFATLTVIISFLLTLQSAEKEDQRQKQEQADREAASFTTETQKYWVEVEQQFADSWPYLAELYKELYPGADITIPKLDSEQTAEATSRQWHMCAQLLQTIENIINTSQVNPQSQNYGWPAVFISWLGSPTLRKVWQQTRQFYNPTTQAFIDGIISGKFKTPKQAQKLVQSFRNQKI